MRAADSYNAPSGGNVVVCEHGVCKRVTNARAQGVFVPTKTATEWTAFRNNLPTNVTLSDVCDANWVYVPPDTDLGTAGFCVMMYEAKNVSGTPTSQAASSPWVNVSHATATSECASLGANYALPTYQQWTALARNVEYVNANWSGGTRGQGCLMIGNVSYSDNCSYTKSGGAGAESGTGRSTKARHQLSTGEYIWDLGGNVSEFVGGSWTGTTGQYVGAYNPGWAAQISGANKLAFGPRGTYGSACPGDTSDLQQCGLGFYNLGNSAAILRGGSYNDSGADVFWTQTQDWTPHDWNGFRCVKNNP